MACPGTGLRLIEPVVGGPERYDAGDAGEAGETVEPTEGLGEVTG